MPFDFTQTELYGDVHASGTHQNIARTCLILEVLAVSGGKGLRLTDVMQRTKLKKTVVHRALTGLVCHGLASIDEGASRYFLGDRIFGWMEKAKERFGLAERIKPYMRSLADDVEDTCIFCIMRGDDMICYARAEGSFPIRTLTLNLGARRPLGVGSGGVAIAAFLPERRLAELIATRREERLYFGIDDDRLLRNITETRRLGYSLHEGLFAKDMAGLGVPVRNTNGEVVATVAINALRSRLEADRLDALLTRTCREVAIIEKELGHLLDEL
jgi:DNA-binding IclR family transcriptional regulator